MGNIRKKACWRKTLQVKITHIIIRYIPLDNFVELVRGISKSQYGSAEFLKAAEGVFVKHRYLFKF